MRRKPTMAMWARKVVLSIATAAWLACSAGAEPPLLEVKHGGPVLAVAWSGDGKLVASTGEDGVIEVVDFPGGKEVVHISAGGPVSGIAFSPDGKLLGIKIRASDGPLKLFELTTKNERRKLSFPGYTCSSLGFTPDGLTLTASGPGEHMVWNYAKGSGYGSREGNVPAGSFAAASPNGLIAAWCDPQGTLKLYYTDQRRSRARLQVPAARGMAFAPDAKSIGLALDDNTIRLWDVSGGEPGKVSDGELRKFDGLREPATLLHFSANGKVLAAASPNDPVIRLWDVASARLRRRLTTNPVGVRALALSPDGRNIALTAGDRMLVWSVATRDLGDLGPSIALSADELRSSWQDLASSDHAKAETAFRKLATAGNHALDFLKREVRAVAIPPLDWKHIDQLLLDLDSPTYSVRQKATVELSTYGELIQVPLQKYVTKNLSPEAQRRATRLLDKLKDPALTADRLRSLEAIEILELVRTAEARQALEELARDSLLAQIRLSAIEALDRLKRPQNGKKS